MTQKGIVYAQKKEGSKSYDMEYVMDGMIGQSRIMIE